jgi:hypothetical protein
MARTALALAILLALIPDGRAEQPPTLFIAGDLPAPAGLTRAELEALGPETAEWTVHGRKRTVVGVSLDKVLVRVGFSAGPMGKDVPAPEKRSGWKKVVVATAADGFKAVFSCAEIFPDMGPTRALVVWKIDGNPLPPEEAPFRLVVTTDKESSRSLYKLVRIEVVDLSAR